MDTSANMPQLLGLIVGSCLAVSIGLVVGFFAGRSDRRRIQDLSLARVREAARRTLLLASRLSAYPDKADQAALDRLQYEAGTVYDQLINLVIDHRQKHNDSPERGQ